MEREGFAEKHRLKLKQPKDPRRKRSVDRANRFHLTDRQGVIDKVDGLLAELSLGTSRTHSLVHLSDLDAGFLDMVILDTVFLLPNCPFGKLHTASNGINPRNCLTQ